MSTFYTADLHLDHENIIPLSKRPFVDIEEMQDRIRANWNTVVGPDDTVVVVGDVALRSVAPLASYIRSLHGTKMLVPGNHDACWGGHRRKQRARNKRAAYIEAGFDEVLIDTCPWWVEGYGVAILSHLPSVGDSQVEERYRELRPKSAGKPIICGHVHEKWTVRGVNINVGVDVHNFTPVSERQLVELIFKSDASHDALIGAGDAH